MPLCIQPKQHGGLGGVAQGLYGAVLAVQVGRGVYGYALAYEHTCLVLGQMLVLQWEERGCAYTHLVLCQSARLVGAYYCCGTHRLACMHLAHQVVGLQHTAHAQCQAQRYTHGQSFGHGHHHQGDGYHEVVQNVLYVVEVAGLSAL